MPAEWSPDEVRVIAAHSDELHPLGVRLLQTMAGTRVVAGKHEAWLRAKCAEWLSGGVAAPAPSLLQPGPLPPDVNLHRFSSIQKAVRLFADGATRNDVARATIFGEKDATRIRRLRDDEYLWLNDERKLGVSALVGRKGQRYALRVWTPGGWIDPLDSGSTPA
jgi:hypothetical protein